jgi:hypothetical protein
LIIAMTQPTVAAIDAGQPNMRNRGRKLGLPARPSTNADRLIIP